MPEDLCLPDDHNDAIEDIVGVLDVTKGPVDQNLQQHLQGEQAGENNVTDLQRVGQFIRLKTEREEWFAFCSTRLLRQSIKHVKQRSQPRCWGLTKIRICVVVGVMQLRTSW